MKKNEKEIILNEYKICLEAMALGFNKDAELNLLNRLMENLNLTEKKYMLINESIVNFYNYSPIVVDTFKMIEASFKKYNSRMYYLIEEVEEFYDLVLSFAFTEEEKKLFEKRINIIKNYLNK